MNMLFPCPHIHIPSSGVSRITGGEVGPEPMVKADISIWYS